MKDTYVLYFINTCTTLAAWKKVFILTENRVILIALEFNISRIVLLNVLSNTDVWENIFSMSK
jgi:hypothetical protein